MGIMNLFGSRSKEKQYLTMSAEELNKLSDEDLHDAVYLRTMKEAGRREVRQCLDAFSGKKRVFYIASLYETEVSSGGLCRFLVGPGRSAAGLILDALKEIHATRHAELLRKFTETNGINLNDLSNIAINTSWEYEERKAEYPFEDFDARFDKLYEKESIKTRLTQYVRNHIEEF